MKHFSSVGLYDVDTLRKIFLEFDLTSWETEMVVFLRTDITVPARMIVDGNTYKESWCRFPRKLIFLALVEGQKHSLNILLNECHKAQRLLGYRTLNLLNSHADSSFLRVTL